GLPAVPQTSLSGAVALIQEQGEQSDYALQLAYLNRGSYVQRLAFLADTDYETFRAREEANIRARYAPTLAAQTNSTGTIDVTQQMNREINSLPSVELYYLSRGALLGDVERWLADRGTPAQLERALASWPATVRDLYDHY